MAFALLLAPALAAPAALARQDGGELARDLGCGACHGEIEPPVALRAELPDLGGAGLRYRPEWIFAYLLAPTRRRTHLGGARMPDFFLQESEAVALARFLGEERRVAPGEWPSLAEGPESRIDGVELRRLLREHSCLACHGMDGEGGRFAPPLDGVGARIRPEWMRQLLVAPDRFGIPDGRMPALFVRRESDAADWRETVPGARADLVRIVDGLTRDGAPERERLAAAWQSAQTRHSGADAALGRRIFVALNCAGCHPHPEIQPWRDRAPPVMEEGRRVREDWLAGYLAAPEPLRVLGTPPGSGSRMPDFGLDSGEVEAILGLLVRAEQGGEQRASAEKASSPNAPLSAFASEKARRLMAEKLPCLGCHRLGGEGGLIGPDLGSLSRRLRPEFIGAVVRAPRELVPHSAMPEVPMPESVRELVVRYLQQNAEPRRPVAYPSLVATPPLDFPTKPEGAALYSRLCAGCHGPSGGGDGPNAPFLPVRPTVHADAAYLSTRPDDVLYDGIAAGGAILGKSQRMPPWGRTLTRTEIGALVRELRSLCRCAGPAWSHGAPAGAVEGAS